MESLEIHSKRNLDEFIETLVYIDPTQENIKHIKCKSSLQLNIYNNDYFLKLIQALATLIIYTQKCTLFQKIKDARDINLSLVTSNVEESLFINYINPTSILLLEYFKTNSKLNLDSFINFNCNELKKEFFYLGQDLINIYSYEKKMQKKEEDIDSIRILSLLNEFKSIINESQATRALCKTKTIHIKNKVPIITDEHGKPIIEHLKNILTNSAIYNINKLNDSYRTALITILGILLYDAHEVILHNSLLQNKKEEVIELLHESTKMYPQLSKLDYFSCKGCALC